MSTPHTPGPWVVAQNHDAMTEVRAGDPRTGRVIATTFCRSSAKTREGNLLQIRTNEANARLIAAAPALLKALIDLLDNTSSHDIEQEYFDAALAAIAEARPE